MRATLICSLFLFVIASTAAQATTFVIDANHPGGIQNVITNEAQNGDVIELLPGTYTGEGNSNINYLGLLITIRSQSGAASCIIDCQNSSGGVEFNSGETAEARLEGVTIRHATAAVLCGFGDNVSPTISQCVFEDGGSGVSVDMGQSPTISDCVFRRNTVGVSAFMANVVISNSIFCANEYGVQGDLDGSITITGSLISGNTIGIDGYRCAFSLSSCTVTGNGIGAYGFRAGFSFANSILWGNCTEALVDGQTGGIGFYCSDVNSAGVEGDSYYDPQCIFVDPVFCDPQVCNSAPNCLGDYGLSTNSPCLASNNPCGELIGARDENCTVISVESMTWGSVKSLYRGATR